MKEPPRTETVLATLEPSVPPTSDEFAGIGVQPRESNEFQASEEKCGPGSTQGEISDRRALKKNELVVVQYFPAAKSQDQVSCSWRAIRDRVSMSAVFTGLLWTRPYNEE